MSVDKEPEKCCILASLGPAPVPTTPPVAVPTPPVAIVKDSSALNIELEKHNAASVKGFSCSENFPASLVVPKCKKTFSLDMEPVPTLPVKSLVPLPESVKEGHEMGSSIEQERPVTHCLPSDKNLLSHQNSKKGTTSCMEAVTDISSSVKPEKAFEEVKDPLTMKQVEVDSEPVRELDLVQDMEPLKDTTVQVSADGKVSRHGMDGMEVDSEPVRELDLVQDMEPLKDTTVQVSTDGKVSLCEEAAIVFMQLEKNAMEAGQGAALIEHQLKQNPQLDPLLPVCQLNQAAKSSTTSIGSLMSPQLSPTSVLDQVSRPDNTVGLQQNPQLDSVFHTCPLTQAATTVELEQDRVIHTVGSDGAVSDENGLKQQIFALSEGQSNSIVIEPVEVATATSQNSTLYEQHQLQENTASQPSSGTVKELSELQLVEYRPWAAHLVSSACYCVESKESLPQVESDGELEPSDFETISNGIGKQTQTEHISKEEEEKKSLSEIRVLLDEAKESLPPVQIEEGLGMNVITCTVAKVEGLDQQVGADGAVSYREETRNSALESLLHSAEGAAVFTAPSRDLNHYEPHPPSPNPPLEHVKEEVAAMGKIFDDAATPPAEKRRKLSSGPVVTSEDSMSVTLKCPQFQISMSDKAIQFPSDEELADDGSDTLFQALPSECAREHPFIPNIPPCWAQDNQLGPNDRDDPPDEDPSKPGHTLQHQWQPGLELLVKEHPQSSSNSGPLQTLLDEDVDTRQTLIDFENQLVPDETWQDSTTSQSLYLDIPEDKKPPVELDLLERERQRLGLPPLHAEPSSKTAHQLADQAGPLLQPRSAYSSCFPQPTSSSKPQETRNTGLGGLANLGRPRLRLGLSKRQKCRSLHDT